MAFVYSSLSACSGRFHSIFVLAFWILFFAQVPGDAAVGVNRSAEVNALLRFRDSNGPGRNEGYWVAWKESDDTPCDWFGVTCTTNYTVEELDFSGWALDISSLEGLYSLADLRRLDLSCNSILVDPLEGLGICNFTAKLTQLDLSSTGIRSTSDPSGMSKNPPACNNLQSSLRVLALQNNALSTFFPGFSDLVNLQFLSLANNLFTGPFPTEELGNLSSLVTLDLSYNSFTGNIPSLPKLTSLFQLILDNNNFTGFDEPWIIGADSLQQLSVSNNQLQGIIPSAIPTLPNLKILKMSRNNLSGNIPPGFSQLMSYRDSTIDLSHNQLTGGIPTDLLLQSNQSDVYASVKLPRNLLTGKIALYGFKPFTFLQFDLSYNNLSGPLPSDTFSRVNSTVGSFRLNDNQLSGDLVDIFFLGPGTMNALEVRLENNLFTGDLSRMLHTSLFLPAWRSMDLSNNNLQWTTSEAITDPITALLTRLISSASTPPSSVEFRAGGNNFSGTLLPTACLVQNTSNFLTVLDLSNSHLHGEILGAAFNSTCLPAIELLNLSNNLATGRLSKSIIANHRQDFILDVSNNRLSGPLPRVLPSDLYNSKYFGGNDGLCGDPLPACGLGKSMAPLSVVGVVLVLVVLASTCVHVLCDNWRETRRERVYENLHRHDQELMKIVGVRPSVPLMPLSVLKSATNDFHPDNLIGTGGSSHVYSGKFVDATGDVTMVAIKKIQREGSPEGKTMFLNEVAISILSQLDHVHLVKLQGCCMQGETALLVFEFIPNGTLQERLRGLLRGKVKPPLTWRQRLNVAVQTADALNYLLTPRNSTRIYHCDVKSANILLDENLNAKVTDFGVSKMVPDKDDHVAVDAVFGTTPYLDPNIFKTSHVTDKSDVYSFGVVLLELISGKPAVGLVAFARKSFKRRDFKGLIDLTLEETDGGNGGESNPTGSEIPLDMQSRAGPSTRPSGNGIWSDSIVAVVILALKCVTTSANRPYMQEVFEVLQTLWDNLNSLGSGQSVPAPSDPPSSSEIMQPEASNIEMPEPRNHGKGKAPESD